ncbi:hypothetical protein F3Y22_tig00113721pilonHSYRG00066 [Hibiscus syriacus]|uniref:DNA (Cytosine-5)-methyltransferase DRM1/2 n=1 Tax=Hibiscus syriacus TaxID=106335 RepID=A0A6A2WNH7_HIBSY|nr:hypothetical protein F3Y22_tig00113721pilonHSYRG00066 [Hibiscus syriacus]
MQHVDSDNNSSDYEVIFQDDFTDIDSSYDTEEILYSDSDEESKLLYLTKMRFSEAEASIAMKKCGSDSSIAELTDFICADQMDKTADVLLPVEDQITQRTLPEDAIESPYFYYEQIHLSNPMIDFGVHTKPDQITQRTLPEDAIEHIILPNSMIGLVQPDQITQRTLPEDAIEHIILPNSMIGSVQPDQITQRTLPEDAIEHIIFVPKYILDECRKWNLVWVGRNKVVPLEPDEVEMLLEAVFYCLGIFLKTDVQELDDDRLEQLMSRFVEFDLVVGDIHNLLKDIMGILLTKKVIGIEEVSMIDQDLSQHQSAGECHKFNSPDFLAS